jgi:hypothetical protein
MQAQEIERGLATRRPWEQERAPLTVWRAPRRGTGVAWGRRHVLHVQMTELGTTPVTPQSSPRCLLPLQLPHLILSRTRTWTVLSARKSSGETASAGS